MRGTSGDFAAFSSRNPRVQLTLLVEEPSKIEQDVLSGVAEIGIAPFYHHVPHIQYESLMKEPHSLYCGDGHGLFDRAPNAISKEDLQGVSVVSRGYVPTSASLYLKERPRSAVVYDMEAMIHLILSGQFVGYVPDHFAAAWVARSRMRPIRPDLFRHVSLLEIAYRKDGGKHRMTAAFLGALRDAHRCSRNRRSFSSGGA